MSDSRYQKLADILVNYSARVKKGETVEVSGQPVTMPLFKEIVKLCYQNGAFVRCNLIDEELNYLKFKYADEKVLTTSSRFLMFDAKNIDAFISLDGELNTNTLANIDSGRINKAQVANKKAKAIIVNKRWVISSFPSTGLAQDANMSLSEFEDFVFSACLQDWDKMTRECKKVGAVMHKAKKMRIIGEETDLTIHIAGCPASTEGKKRQGEYNLPDGEVFTSPQRYLTEGHIYFPWPSKKAKEVRDVRLVFKKGKVVKATSSLNEDYLQEVLRADNLSNSLGEAAIGMNYGIKKYTNNILFDEKIGGTIHIALGAGYKEAGGDPNSAVHWDLVKDLRDGGEVWMDDKLAVKNGKVLG